MTYCVDSSKLKTIPLTVLFFCFLPLTLWGQESWQKQWDANVTEAKKEGRVVVVGTADSVMRNEFIPRFTTRFGIPVEYIAGRGPETFARVRTEQQAGIYAIDVFLASITNISKILYPEKMLDPLKPVLILPEVMNPTKWKMNKLWFIDPEEKYVLRVFRHAQALLYINTDFVKADEMRSARDLLNPKWRGKMATDDPAARTGAGTSLAYYFYLLFGPEFVKSLFLDQQPVRSRDKRQLTEWLARGTYPICFACDSGIVHDFQQEGFKIAPIYELSDVPSMLSASSWLVGLANKAPHPHAARVFANWAVTKDALDTYSRGDPIVTLRSDVDESFLDPRIIPRPGVNYIWDNGIWDFIVRDRDQLRERVLKLLKSG